MSHHIRQPVGFSQNAEHGNFTLEWNPSFAARGTAGFNRAQRFVDSEVLRHSAPLVPFDTGQLVRSGTTGTNIGSGRVTYSAPYAVPQYFSARSRVYDPARGGYWFERMKAAHADQILGGAANILKGGR